MSLPFKILQNLGSAVNFGAAGSAYTTESTVTIAAAANYTVPAGYQFVTGDGTGAQFQYSPNSGTTWRQVNTNGYGGDCYSDGYNWRVHNNATTAITIYVFSIA